MHAPSIMLQALLLSAGAFYTAFSHRHYTTTAKWGAMAFYHLAHLQAGRLLAHVLMGSGHGDRPVTLIGHSMGARVIFHCLLELCRHNCKGVFQKVSS